MTRYITLKIHGKVQGVCFRMYAEKKAKELELAGFVRNEPDGTVYIEAGGGEEKIGEFVKWCRQGPEWAEVKKVDVSEGGEGGGLKGFTIKY